jgi:RNA polymerase sigma factor (sigma-70 family)
MWSLSDESLIAGVAAGDPDAATAFVRRFQARVFGLALTIVRDPATAEEVAQDAFLRAWKHAGAYDPRRGRVVTWLLSITRNLAVDAIRMKRFEPLDPETLLSFQEPLDDQDAVTARADSRALLSAVAGLPTEQRRALLLSAFCGRTAREIAELDGVPLGTVKTRIRAAMLKLRDEVSSEA